MRCRSAIALVSGLLALFVLGCKKQPAAPATTAATPSAAARPNEPFVHIDSVSPNNFTLSGNQVWIGDVTVTYTLTGFAPTDPAKLELYNTATGVIAETEVSMQEHGQFEWRVGANATVGPTVRMRVNCPNFTTDWAVLGLMHQAPSNAPVHIDNIMPNPVYGNIRTDGPVPLTLSGEGFEQGCTSEASISNGFAFPMTTTYGGPKQLYATLDSPDLRSQPLSERYIQLKLIVRPQKGMAREDVAWIDVTDQ